MNYSDKLKDPRWQKKRLLIMSRDEFKCRMCGDSESTLHVHHLKYSKDPWDVPNKDLITLCEDCHGFTELYKDKVRRRDSFKIHRIGNWEKGSIIKFILFDDKIKLHIFDKNNGWIGFDLSEKNISELKIMIKSFSSNIRKENSTPF
jgi:predicted nucleic-acid-binding Zn-ribbon protein